MKNIKAMIITLLVLALVACNQAPAKTEQAASQSDSAQLEGAVIVDGSGTVYPLMASIAEAYMTTEQPNVSVQVGRSGSSAGFKKFIKDEIDFADASRMIKSQESEQFFSAGFTADDLMEVKLALDGLTIIINKENNWAQQMTEQEVINMYVAGAYRADDQLRWSDIRPDWPAEQINFYGPNENHGTYEFFYENILDEQEMIKTVNLQQEYATLVDLVSKDKNAIAFCGFGYYDNNKAKINAVAIDFGEGPIAPTLETISETGPYQKFTRPVFTYINLSHALAKPQVLDFAKYIVSERGAMALAAENGFAPLPAEFYRAYRDVLDNIGN